MKSLIKNKTVLISLTGISMYCTVPNANGQAMSHNNNVWFHYSGKNLLTKKLSFTFETTMRFANGLDQKQQWFIRPSFDYGFNKKFTGSLGYTHYANYVYGQPAIYKTMIPENHVWIQGAYAHKLGNAKLSHRLRDENRFVGIAIKQTDGYVIDHYQYRNRLRYMLIANLPLIKKDGQSKLFGVLGDEVFLNIGKVSGSTLLNQNRAIIGIGYNFNPMHQVQLNFIHQTIWNYTNTLIENNPTLRISYITNISWLKNETNEK